MSSLFTGTSGGFDGNQGGGAAGGGAGAPKRSEWRIEFGEYSSFMVLPAQMRAVRETSEQWLAHLARAPPLALNTPAVPAAAAAAAGTRPAAASAAAQSNEQASGKHRPHCFEFGDRCQYAHGEVNNSPNGATPAAAAAAAVSAAEPAATAAAVQPVAAPAAAAAGGGAPINQPAPPHYLMVETPHTPHVHATPLRAILDHPIVPATFRCVVRIADLLPRTEHGFIAPFCDFCQRCSVSPQCVVPPPPAAPLPPTGRVAAVSRRGAAPPALVQPSAAAAAASTPHMICERCHGQMTEWTYMAVLKLVDESGSLGALLYRDAGETFFDGTKASGLRHDR